MNGSSPQRYHHHHHHHYHQQHHQRQQQQHGQATLPVHTGTAATTIQKRPREICIPTVDPVVQKWIAELHQSLTTKQRLATLRRLQNELLLSSSSPKLIDWFVELGGLEALMLQLGLVLDRPHVSTVQEVHGLCHCIDAILRQSTNHAREIILDSLFDHEDLSTVHVSSPSLLLLLERASRLWEAPQIPSVAHWISASARGTELLLHSSSHCSGGLLRRMTVLLLFLSHRDTTNSTTTLTSTSTRLAEVLGCFKNISYFDRQGRLLAEPDFLQNLTKLSLSTHATLEGERLSAIWRNLALIHDGRVRLKQQVDILRILHTLATLTTPEQQDLSGKSIYRNVLNTAIHLSMDPDFCVSFLLYGDGLYTNLLQRCLLSDDDTTRKRAARAIRLWATHAASANLLVQASELIGVLSQIAVQDDDAQVRHEAAEAFGRCASWIQSPMPQHEAVLRALVELCRSAPPAIVARAIRGQAELPNNRTILAHEPILMETLINIAGHTELGLLIREDACTALQHLVTTPDNRRTLLLLSSDHLLDALTVNMGSILAAAEIVMNLAQDEASRLLLIKHDRLLKALIRCAAQPDYPLKQELKQIILQLVQEL